MPRNSSTMPSASKRSHSSRQMHEHSNHIVSPWKEDETQACINLWKLTPDQQDQFLQLRDRLADITHWKNSPYEVIRFWHEFQHHHHALQTMEDRFRTMMEWRAEHEVDNLLAEYSLPSLYRYFPAGVLVGRDNEGDPIYIERTGDGDTLALLHKYGREEMVAESMWMRELMSDGPWVERYEAETGHKVKQFTVILDLKGLNRRHLAPSLVPVGQQVTRLVQDNYPGFGKRILVIRAPAIFRWVWSIFKPMVDPHVQKMLTIATEKETDAVLAQYMDLSILPPAVCPKHGQGRAERGFDTIWEGGPLPDEELPPSEEHQEVRRIMAEKRRARLAAIKTVAPSTPVREDPDRMVSDGASSTSSWEKVPPPTPNDTTDDNQRWSDANFQEMVRAWKFTPLQQQHMLELKHRLRDVQHWKNEPFEVARYYNEFVKHHKHHIHLSLRHSREHHHEHPHHPWSHEFSVDDAEEQAGRLRSHDLDVVEEKFRAMIHWRIEHDMDTFLERYQQPDPIFHYKPVAILEGLDRDGDPIYVDRIGSDDSYGFLKRTSHRDIVEYITFIREYVSQRQTWSWYEERQGHRPANMTVIIDMQGLNRDHGRPGLFAVLKEASRISQDMYAGWGKRIILLRTPAMFRMIWKIVSHFFDKHIQEMIIFTTHHDYAEILDQFIERDVLPPELGGNGKLMPGYFENYVRLEGGPVPSQEELDKHLAAASNLPTQPHGSKSQFVKCVSSPLLKGCWDDINNDTTCENSALESLSVRLFPSWLCGEGNSARLEGDS